MLEIEAKFYVQDFQELRVRLGSLGALLLEPRHHERNLRFDTPEGTLTSTRRVLRIRQGGRTLLTFKQPLQGEMVREEIEFEVSQGSAARDLLERLGYRVIACYEKWRETYRLEPSHVMLDELPYGRFVEVEAPSESSLAQSVSMLGLDWERRVRQTYLDLFDRLRTQRSLDSCELTFDRFAGLPAPSPEELGVEVGFSSPIS